MTDLELKLPEDILENIPSGKDEMVKYLAHYFDKVIDHYDGRFQKRVQGAMGGPLSRYEKAILKDFLIEMTMGNLEEAAELAAETLTTR